MTRLEHVGIAVEDSTPVRTLLAGLLGLTSYKIEQVRSESVDTHFIGAGGTKIELLQTDEPNSAVGKFLERRGEGIHHLAFEVDDLDQVLKRAAEMGLTPINPEPKEGADGKRIFFLHPKQTHGILIEVCQEDRFPGSQTTVEMPHGMVAAFESGHREAPCVLLMHDAGSSSLADFKTLISRLEPSSRLVAFDAPGHGASREWSNSNHFLRAADKHARVVLNAVGAESVVVAGRGLGAAAASALAVNYPERVHGLVLLDPNLLDSPDDVAAARQTILENCGETLPDLAATLSSTLDEAAQASVPINRVLELTCPILICCSTRAALQRSLRLHGALDGSSLAVIPDSKDDAALAAIIGNFVRTVDA